MYGTLVATDTIIMLPFCLLEEATAVVMCSCSVVYSCVNTCGKFGQSGQVSPLPGFIF